jgi:hypothetical protein
MADKSAPTVFEHELRSLTPEQFDQAAEILENVRAARSGKETPADRELRTKVSRMNDAEFDAYRRSVLK